jgi:copper resistance protein C
MVRTKKTSTLMKTHTEPFSPRGLIGHMLALVTLSLLLGSTLGIVAPSQVFAHNQVTTTSPEQDEVVVESPLVITIQTSDMLLDLGGEGRGFAIAVTDDEGLYYGDGCVSVVDSTMETTLELGAKGTYTITYQYVSADGHSLSDRYSFIFEPAASHTPAAGVAEAPVCGADSPPSEAADTTPEESASAPVASADSAPPQDENPGLIVAGVAVAALAVAALVVLLRKRKSVAL